MGRTQQARTLDEVAVLAGRLRGSMQRRGVHKEVLAYCEVEILRRSIFHAVFEATKGLASRLRTMTGSELDGAELVDACFNRSDPVIRINAYTSKSDTSEHSGFANLLRGVFGTFRNPVAHTPRIGWNLSEGGRSGSVLDAVLCAPSPRSGGRNETTRLRVPKQAAKPRRLPALSAITTRSTIGGW
jgi:uncharacterized protein (TIGR02391 family)